MESFEQPRFSRLSALPPNQVRRAGYGGRGFSDEGTLNRHDVWRALEELGIRVDGWEADALLDRFTAEDGSENKVRRGKQAVQFLYQKKLETRRRTMSHTEDITISPLFFVLLCEYQFY